MRNLQLKKKKDDSPMWSLSSPGLYNSLQILLWGFGWSLFPLIYGLKQLIKQEIEGEKNQGFLTHSTNQEIEGSKIFIMQLIWEKLSRDKC